MTINSWEEEYNKSQENKLNERFQKLNMPNEEEHLTFEGEET